MRRPPRHDIVCAGAALAVATLVAWAVLREPADLWSLEAAGFAVLAIAASLTSAVWNRSLEISSTLMVALAAAAFVGPFAGLAVALVGELSAWRVERLRRVVLPINVLSVGAPAVLAGFLLDIAAGPAEGVMFYAVFGALAASAVGANLLLVCAFGAALGDAPFARMFRGHRAMAPVWATTIGGALALAIVYGALGPLTIVIALPALVGFAYQARLVSRAEDQSRRYASLSWGVLSGMIRNLDARDKQASRHSAAVARFSRDIAAVVGMSESDQELVHVAGLLHDIGRFALSDRVMEPEAVLDGEDWKRLVRHPELGADMLNDMNVFGPVPEIVRGHHERLDGKGYPNGLGGDEILELAKIVAVAEVYDTLTAGGAYRPTMSSFEALTELRRVSGSQLEGRYVEALGEALAGRGLEYRHASGVDFDAELALERRIEDAAAAGRRFAEVNPPVDPADEPNVLPLAGAIGDATKRRGPRAVGDDAADSDYEQALEQRLSEVAAAGRSYSDASSGEREALAEIRRLLDGGDEVS